MTSGIDDMGSRYLSDFISAVLAGIMIAIAAMVYMSIGGVAGAILFAFGLMAILGLKLKLYTGRIGDIKGLRDIPEILVILIGNFIGCLFSLLAGSETARRIVEMKMSSTVSEVIVKAIICGIIICACVKIKDNFFTVFAVAAFILSGAEHSIADMCYIIASRSINSEAYAFLLLVIIGNAVGAILLSYCLRIIKNSDRRN